MEARIKIEKAAPGAVRAMLDLQKYVDSCGLEESLLDLIRLRSSQINGCAYCIDMHTKDARARGESEQRLYELDAWRETPFYTEREMAALAWTEAVTLITSGHVPDEVYEQARKQFSEKELVEPHARHRINKFLEPHEYLAPHCSRDISDAQACSVDTRGARVCLDNKLGFLK